jgi:tyrosyl-tRNA synthetase
MGGSDQWGNIVTGTELIRRKAAGEAFAFTCPLITKADGGKFGKTEKGNIWLDPARTSPYQFYQFWLNVADADAEKYIRIFTFLSREEIEKLIAEHEAAPHLRILQKRLAKEVTVFIHGEKEYAFAVKASEILFGNATADMLGSLSENQLLQVMEGVPQVQIPAADLEAGTDIVTLLASAKIFPSKGEARKGVQNGGVSINKEKIASIDHTVNAGSLINGSYILVQKGKKNYYLLKAV